MSGIFSAMFDPILFGMAIGINMVIRYLKPVIRLISSIIRTLVLRISGKDIGELRSTWYRSATLILSYVIVVNYNSQWIHMKLIDDSKLATVFYLWVVSWVIYDLGVKFIMESLKKKFEKELD